MKVFERLVKNHICSSIPLLWTLFSLPITQIDQLTMPPIRSCTLPSNIDSKHGNYVRLLFIDYSSAFNTIVPICMGTSALNWLDSRFPHRQTSSGESRPVHLQLHHLNIRAPQGCVLSPLLYSLHTHNVSSHSSTSIVKLMTVVLGLISNNDETPYLDEVVFHLHFTADYIL